MRPFEPTVALAWVRATRLGREDDARQRRQQQANGVGAAHPRSLIREQLLAAVAKITAGIELRIRVEDLDVTTRRGDADPVVVPGYRREVHDDGKEIVTCAAQEAQHGLRGVVAVDPLEA